MKLGVALALVVAYPSVATAQYNVQLRPSPYRILSGWEQGANTGGQTSGRVTRAVTPVSDRKQAGPAEARPDIRNRNLTGSTRAPN